MVALLVYPVAPAAAQTTQAPAGASTSDVKAYTIPPQALARALASFGQQSGLQVSFDASLAGTAQSAAVSGSYSADEALRRLLAGTGLGYRYINARTVSLYRLPAGTAPDSVALPAVTVEATRDSTFTNPASGYVATNTTTGAKTDTPLIEIPQSISVVTRQQMDQRQTQTIDEALRYSPGISVSGKEDNRSDFVAARGFTLNQYLDSLRLGAGSFATSQTDPYLLERIDVLQGPASTLYGRSSPGGLIDMVSKRPRPDFFGEAQIQTGSFNRIQGAFDVGGALDKNGEFQVRLTALARDADTQVNYVKNRRIVVAPSFTWRPSSDTSFTLITNYQDDPAGGLYSRMPASGSITPTPTGVKIPTSFFFSDLNFNKYQRSQYSLGYAFEHRFTDSLQFCQNLRYRHMDLDYDFLYATGWLNATTLRRNVISDREKLDTTTLDNQVQYDVRTGPLAHKVLAGVDYQYNNWDYLYGVAVSNTLNYYNPNYRQNITKPAITNSQNQTQDQFGVYLQDQIKIERAIFTIGAREDWAATKTRNRLTRRDTSQSDRAFTWRAGVNYIFDNGIAPYASYTRSFDPTAGVDFYGTPLKPTTGEQYEVGVKYQPTGFKSFITAAAYNLTQQNVTTADPSHPNSLVQTGEIRSRGVQFAGTASLADGLDLIASYSYLDNEVTKSNDGLVGKKPSGTPAVLASAWGNWTIQSGPLAGLGIGAGVRYVGSTWGDNANSFKVPSYTLGDAAIQYEFSYLDPRFSGLKLAINANNITDKTYVAACSTSTTCFYGYRRNVLATLTYKW